MTLPIECAGCTEICTLSTSSTLITGGSQVTLLHDSLTQPLPFEDGYFHHVRATSIAKGVPEDKVRAVAVQPCRPYSDN